MVDEACNLLNQTLLIHSRIAQGPKENLPLIVVDTMDRASLAGKMQTCFGANEP